MTQPPIDVREDQKSYLLVLRAVSTVEDLKTRMDFEPRQVLLPSEHFEAFAKFVAERTRPLIEYKSAPAFIVYRGVILAPCTCIVGERFFLDFSEFGR